MDHKLQVRFAEPDLETVQGLANRNGPMVLCIDAPTVPLAGLLENPESLNVIHGRWHWLSMEQLEIIDPDKIVTLLVGRVFDAADMIYALVTMEFEGELLVLTLPLPERDELWHELAGRAEGFDVTLLKVLSNGKCSLHSGFRVPFLTQACRSPCQDSPCGAGSDSTKVLTNSPRSSLPVKMDGPISRA